MEDLLLFNRLNGSHSKINHFEQKKHLKCNQGSVYSFAICKNNVLALCSKTYVWIFDAQIYYFFIFASVTEYN